MKKYTLRALLLSIFLSAAASPVFVFASPEIKPFCTDYSLSNVSLEMASELDTAPAGSTIMMRGIVTNKGNFPITEGSLLVKVYTSDRMVDRFIVPLNISLGIGEHYTFSFPWKTAVALVNGTYDIAASFVSSGKFAFGNSSLSDEKGIGSAQVTIVNGSTKEVYFNKKEIKVGGDTSLEKNFILEVPLVSSFTTATDIAVKWSIYAGTGIDDVSLVDSHVDTVTVPVQGTKKVSYVVTDTSATEYYAVVEAKYADTKSIALIPFSRFGKDSSIFRFVGLKTTQEGVMISGCIANSFDSSEKTVGFTVTDAKGQMFSTTFAAGTSSSVGFSELFPVKKAQGNIMLSAVVQDTKGNTLDAVNSRYDCADVGLCTTSSTTVSNVFDSQIILYTLVTIGALLLLAFIIRRKSIRS